MSSRNLNIIVTPSKATQNLVLFHGWGFDHQIWQPILPFLTEFYTIYRVDLPGFGLSSELDWPEFKKKLLAQLPDKFIIAGWSLGGLYSTRLALEETKRISHLINIASTPRFIKDTDWPGVEAKLFDDFYRNFIINPSKTLDDFIRLQMRDKSEHTRQQVVLPATNGLQKGLEILQNWDLREELHTLNMPVCYVFGRLDAIVSYKMYHRMQLLYPQNHYVLFAKSAHAPFLSDKEKFANLLKEFTK